MITTMLVMRVMVIIPIVIQSMEYTIVTYNVGSGATLGPRVGWLLGFDDGSDVGCDDGDNDG